MLQTLSWINLWAHYHLQQGRDVSEGPSTIVRDNKYGYPSWERFRENTHATIVSQSTYECILCKCPHITSNQAALQIRSIVH